MFGSVMKARFVNAKTGEEIKLFFSPPINESREAKKFVSWFNDNRVKQYLSMQNGLTESSELEWIRKQSENESQLVWFVYVKDLPIGSIGLHNIDMQNRQAELGISIGDKALWGKGMATVMEIAVIDYAFQNVVAGGLHKIYARVYGGNIASQKVIEEKIGFRTVGVRKENTWFNGAWHDEWNGEMLAESWTSKRDDVIKSAGIASLELYPGCE